MELNPRVRAPLLTAFFGGLHLLVLVALWRRGGGAIAGGVVLLSAIPLTIGSAYLLRRVVRPLSGLDLLVLLYALYSVASLVLYFQAGNPSRVTAYAFGLYHFVLPIACYFAGKAIAREPLRGVLSGLILLNAFTMAYGLYMHVVRPDYYVNFVTASLTPSGATQDWQFFARMQSYLGSTSVGYISTVSIVLASIATDRVKRFLPLFALLFAAGAALSLQRASFVALVVALAYLVFAFRQHRLLRIATVATFAGALVYGSTRLGDVVDPFAANVQSRATSGLLEGLSSFVEERGYRPGMQYLERFPLGVGVGATSSAAENAGLVGDGEVADANFMRIAADLGVFGLLLFLLVLGAACARAWASPNRMAWLSFLLIHSGIMLTTNVFDSFYISHSFWLCLALLDQDQEAEAAAAAPSVAPTSLRMASTAAG